MAPGHEPGALAPPPGKVLLCCYSGIGSGVVSGLPTYPAGRLPTYLLTRFPASQLTHFPASVSLNLPTYHLTVRLCTFPLGGPGRGVLFVSCCVCLHPSLSLVGEGLWCLCIPKTLSLDLDKALGTGNLLPEVWFLRLGGSCLLPGSFDTHLSHLYHTGFVVLSRASLRCLLHRHRQVPSSLQPLSGFTF